MTRTRSSSTNIPCTPRLRKGTKQQTVKSMTMQKMRIKKPRTRIKPIEDKTDKETTGNTLHMDSGYLTDPHSQESVTTRLQGSDSDDNDSFEDEELPAIEFNSTTAQTKAKELVPGTMVWALSPPWPHWPAVLIRRISNERSAWVYYLDQFNQRAKVSLRSMSPFFGPLRSQFIEKGKASKYRDDFTASLDLAEDYLIKQGLGKSAVSATSVPFSSDVNKCTSHSVSPKMKPSVHDTTQGMTLVHETTMVHGTTEGMTMVHETTECISDNSQPTAPLSSSYSMSADEEILVGHPVVPSNQNGCSKEDLELTERRKAWEYTENRLLKYIQRDTTKNHLLAIYSGKINSERHKLFKSRRAKDRQQLRLMAGVGPITDERLESELTCFLKDLYVEHCMECKEDLPDTSYITEVWLPEAIIFAIQKTRRVGRKKAEKLFHSEGVQFLVDLGEDMPIVPSITNQTLSEI